MDIQQAVSLPRQELETGLQAIALLLFRNELRPDTAPAIEDLKAGLVCLPTLVPCWPCAYLSLQWQMPLCLAAAVSASLFACCPAVNAQLALPTLACCHAWLLLLLLLLASISIS